MILIGLVRETHYMPMQNAFDYDNDEKSCPWQRLFMSDT